MERENQNVNLISVGNIDEITKFINAANPTGDHRVVDFKQEFEIIFPKRFVTVEVRVTIFYSRGARGRFLPTISTTLS